MQTIRAFIAIDPNLPTREKIQEILSCLKLKHPAAKVKWIKPDNLHFTLRFLGKTQLETVNELNCALNTVVQSHKPFSLHLKKIIIFPKNHPKIIALATELSEELATVVRHIETSMQDLGYEPEQRPFLPHLTLGRISGRTEFELSEVEELLPLEFKVEEIILYQSELTPSGSIYTALKKYPFL